MWHDAHGSSNAARFASHSAWELQHDQQITQDQARQDLKHAYTEPLTQMLALDSFICSKGTGTTEVTVSELAMTHSELEIHSQSSA